jgi:two-component system sensor histidine kinase PilS (NtrC family)
MALAAERDPESSYGLLRVYSYYRATLSVLLILMYFLLRRSESAASLQHELYLYTAIPYAVLTVTQLVFVLLRPVSPRPRHIFAMLVVDIASQVLITHASGGINGGFAVLLMVTTGAAAVFVPGQIATLVAALTSLAVLSEAMWIVLRHDAPIGEVFSAGVLGVLLFASSMLVQRLAIRLQRSQALASQRAREVSELQQLNQLIVQRMQTGILLVDADSRIRIANHAAARLLGTGERELTDDDASLPAAITAALDTWRRNPSRLLAPFKLREHGPQVQLSFARLESAAGDTTLVFAEDFTRIAQQAQQLKLASLGRLTASIAHEIRNPLGSISHAAQLLRESSDLPADDHRLVEIVIGNAERTNDVIESVLTLSRGQQPRPERVRLAEWLQRFAAELRQRTHDARVEVDVAADAEHAEANADPTHLRQILQNLAENGLRYSLRASGEPSLTLRLALDTETGLPRLDVIDQGAGVPAEDIDRIFEPFFTTEATGTGLGLYLSRELCEASLIRLEYRVEPGSGGCFRLSFPHPERRTAPVSNRPSP